MTVRKNFIHTFVTFGIVAVALVFTSAVNAQTPPLLPDKIRGYKVHDQRVLIKHDDLNTNNAKQANIIFSEPLLLDISLSGITLSVDAEIMALLQSGRVDMLTFHDLKVNDIPVSVEEYTEPFSFKKNAAVKLPVPARIFLPTGRMLQAAVKEMRETKDEWTVRGRIFVFGKFRKFGFMHKRVVPVDIDLKIKNPFYVTARR